MIKFVGNKDPDIKRLEELLQESSLTNQYTNDGPVKHTLERRLEEILCLPPTKRAVCFNNGTSALHALMFYCEKTRGPQHWVTPAFTFPSAVVGGAFKVEILDIDPATYTLPMDESLLEEYGGVILTNLFGSYVDLTAWENFCKKTNKILIFDNASSPLSTCEGSNICNFGDYAFSSLHHTKLLGFGEGGFAVVPANQYKDVNAINNFGFDNNRKYDKRSSNFKMPDTAAAFILSHLETFSLEDHLQVQDRIQQASGLTSKLFNWKPGTVYGNLPLVLPSPVSVESFKESNVEVKKYYMPLLDLPASQKLYAHILNLPLHGKLTAKEVDDLVLTVESLPG